MPKRAVTKHTTGGDMQLPSDDVKQVHMVMDGHTLQGLFMDEALARQFASHFQGATVEPESLYMKMPKLYTWEARLLIATGELIETVECKPSFDKIILQLDRTTLLAVGESKEEAEKNAKDFHKVLTSKET